MATKAETPMPPANADLRMTWEYLEDGVDCIMTRLRGGISYVKYVNLYTVAYNYCVSSRMHGNLDSAVGLGGRTGTNLMGSDLYNKLTRYFVGHVTELRNTSESMVDEALLRYYAREWDRYTTGANYVNRVFTFFNQHWVKRERDEGRKNVYQVYTLGLVQWKLYFFLHVQQKHAKLSSAVLKLVELQRNGETIDQGLVKKVVDSFVSLGLDGSDTNKASLKVYEDHFEGPFIAATEKYYKTESETFLAENTVSEYIKRAEKRLREEDRIQIYLNSNTRKILIQKCGDILFRDHSERIWNDLQQFFDYDKHEDLDRMFVLLSRFPEELEHLRKKFEENVKRAGNHAISKLVGESGADVDSLEPKVYVNALLEVYRKNWDTLKKSFKSNMGFAAALDKACIEFVNRNAVTGASTTKSPELLAKHVDALLRKSNKLTESELEDDLNQVMVLFKYIDDKDVFRKFYTIKLSKRLIHNVPAFDEAEASMISKLKGACGFEYTNKLQCMFNDMCLSKDLTGQFKEHIDQSGDTAGGDITFGIMVLGTNFWPLNAPVHEFVIPREILPTYERFTRYYQKKHSGRKLTWLWNYSKNELLTNYLNQKYILMTSSHQMAVLIQYNTNDTLSLDELISVTGITKDLLMQILGVLVKAKVLINEETGQYDLNPNFKSKKTRVNLNLPIKAEVKAETADVLKAVDEDRKHVIQVTIVRIMKVRKSLKNQTLIAEVVSQISQRFTPDVGDIKKAIEILLEQEYIERAEGQRDTYNYLA